MAARDALAKTGTAASPPVLALLQDAESDLRSAAARILGQIKEPRATDLLLDTLGDPDPSLRSVAVEALADIDDSRAIVPMINMLEDTDPHVRGAAVLAFERFCDPRALPALECLRGDTATNDEGDEIGDLAAYVIEQIERHEQRSTLKCETKPPPIA